MLTATVVQIGVAHAQLAYDGRTQIRLERAGSLAQPVVASIRLMLPNAVLKPEAGDTRSFEPGESRTLVVDPVAGDWFSYVEKRDG